LKPLWKVTVPCGVCPSKGKAKKTSGGTQRRDDELLRVMADLQGLKRRDGHLGYGPYIGVGFASDNNFRIPVSCIPPSWLLTETSAGLDFTG
jgi:hypothetical protein